jgi:hypothetical protein
MLSRGRVFLLDVALWSLRHVTKTTKELAASVVRVKMVRMEKQVFLNVILNVTLQFSHPRRLL